MKNKKPNAELLWKQMEDLLVPRLRLSPIEHTVYCHLLRHSHLEGRSRLRFSLAWLARGAQLSGDTARKTVRRLVARGVLRLVQRGRAGHMVDVRLPGEIRAVRKPSRPPRAVNLEDVDFLETRALRQAIYAREHSVCFYCMRRLSPTVRCLDHVVPQARSGGNSYRNLVACCVECNSQKGERGATDFLRWLYRERRLSAGELTGRLRALDAVTSGKLRPSLP